MQKSYYQQLALLPLGPSAVAELLRELLGPAAEQAGLGERIRARTGGNPFFVEEVVQSLVEAGTLRGERGAYRLGGPLDELVIPATVQADAVAARPPSDPRLGAELRGYSPYTPCLNGRGLVLLVMGRLADAERDFDRARELARDHGELDTLSWIWTNRVLLMWARGDAGPALESGRAAADLAERTGSNYSRAAAYSALGMAYVVGAEWIRAAEALESALAIARSARTGLDYEAALLSRCAEAYLGCGQLDRAATAADAALRLARERGEKSYECEAHLTRARVLRTREGRAAREAIARELDEAQALIRETGAALYEPFARVERAELARRQRELREAQRLFLAMGATARAERLAAELS
jgi:adenylate cyclase